MLFGGVASSGSVGKFFSWQAPPKMQAAAQAAYPPDNIPDKTRQQTSVMPPRVGPRSSQVPGTQQSLRSSTTTAAAAAAANSARQTRIISQRDFSQSCSAQFQSTSKNDTRLRRNMFAWLNGPGRVFREQLQGSTNYLSAYDRAGNLMRMRQDPEQDNEDQDGEDKKMQDNGNVGGEEKAAEDRDRLPRERAADLRPYPLNNNFRSQAVLSEELREELYKKIVHERIDLPTVSALYGVDMRRVAAVVRLKTIEKDWVLQVCFAFFSLPSSTFFSNDEMYKKRADKKMTKKPGQEASHTIRRSRHANVTADTIQPQTARRPQEEHFTRSHQRPSRAPIHTAANLLPNVRVSPFHARRRCKSLFAHTAAGRRADTVVRADSD
jgi:hypothetical protein